MFQQNSRGENFILDITEKEMPELRDLANQLLGKEVFVSWPHLQEAKVRRGLGEVGGGLEELIRLLPYLSFGGYQDLYQVLCPLESSYTFAFFCCWVSRTLPLEHSSCNLLFLLCFIFLRFSRAFQCMMSPCKLLLILCLLFYRFSRTLPHTLSSSEHITPLLFLE